MYWDDVQAAPVPTITSMNYIYDGFGNLTSKGAMNGQFTTSMVVEGLTNRIVSAGGVAVNYSASGNALNPAATPNSTATSYIYDRLNRLVATSNNGAQAAGYGYLPGRNERIMYSSGPNRNYLIVYGPDGNEIGGYLISSGALPTAFSPTLYLDGKSVSWNEDRLGSQGNPLPYGDFLTATSAYATYFFDGGGSGMWFAKQRYYNSSWGRFATSDPYGGSAKSTRPQSWNRYAYVEGDPINEFDPTGEFMLAPQPDWSFLLRFLFWGPQKPVRPVLAEAPSPFCDRSNPTNAKVLDFIDNNEEAAESVAAKTGLSADFILAWGAFESAYGTGSAAKLNDNFFGLTAPNSSSTGGWIGAAPCKDQGGKTFAGFACFPGGSDGSDLGLSAVAALTSQNNRYLNAALGSQKTGGGIADTANAIAKAGFNSEPINYGASVRSAANAIAKRKDCDN